MSFDPADFHISHTEKIEWMVEVNGWAIEVVPANTNCTPPMPGYTYTVGFPAAVGFPEVAVFGLTPSAARGLLDLVADLRRDGTEIPLAVELAGLFDGDLRCVFAPIDLDEWGALFATAAAWHRSEPFDVVQLMWPDRQGFLPTEAGFEQRLCLAQPVIGRVG